MLPLMAVLQAVEPSSTEGGFHIYIYGLSGFDLDMVISAG